MATGNGNNPEETRLLGRLRVAAGAVVLTLIVILVLASIFGPVLDRGYRISETLFGALLGALIVLLRLAIWNPKQ